MACKNQDNTALATDLLNLLPKGAQKTKKQHPEKPFSTDDLNEILPISCSKFISHRK